MELKQNQTTQKTRCYLLFGVLVFLSAIGYYLLFREQLPWPGYLLNFNYAPLAHLSDLSRGAYPSFAFTLSLGLIAIGLFKLDKIRSVTALFGIWFIGVLHEVMLGTFSALDIIAGSIGVLIPLLLIITARQQTVRRTQTDNRFTFNERLKLSALMLVSATLATGTSQYGPTDSDYCTQFDENGTCVERSSIASPVYMSYAELRSAVKMTPPKEMTSVNRIYLYQSMLFVNDRNNGIHVIDNRFPNRPERIGFIEIPGNTEISIREDNLYADSYIDLVTLDLRNTANIIEIARQEAIFPYNARQNIPNNIRLTNDIDSANGVVVGYQ